MSSFWKCTVCGKPKTLAGAHLAGKKEVQRDCWPCATKRLLRLTEGGGDAQDVAEEEPVPEKPAETKPSNPFATTAAAIPSFGAATTEPKAESKYPNPFATTAAFL